MTSLFEHPDFDNHESVTLMRDEAAGLFGIVAVHSTALGPAAGGTRLWKYTASTDGITDALRLSRAMSLKNAMAGIPHGGGKGVILRPDRDFDREALFAAYGRGLNRIGGAYYTAEDVGVSPEDMRVIRAQTPYVAGLDEGEAASGDPSPITADGVFRCLKYAVHHKLDKQDISKITVSIQGLGHVGYALAEHLHNAGAKLIVTDMNEAVLDRAKTELGAQVVGLDDIYDVETDVFAPCALGGAINIDTINRLKVNVICGAANNQLATADSADVLNGRGILYCPDYVVNGGGIINVASELSGQYDIGWVDSKLDGLVETLRDIINEGEHTGLNLDVIAEKLALSRISAANFKSKSST